MNPSLSDFLRDYGLNAGQLEAIQRDAHVIERFVYTLEPHQRAAFAAAVVKQVAKWIGERM